MKQLDGRPNLISHARAVFSPPLPVLYAVRSIHPLAINSWSVDMGLFASYTTCVRSVYSLGGGCYWLRRSLYSVGLFSPRARMMQRRLRWLSRSSMRRTSPSLTLP